MTKKLAAEFVGTFALVFFGCGAIVLAGFGLVGQEGIAWAFGLAVLAVIYGLGPISGGHVNPAVSFAYWVAGRLTTTEMLGYWIAQCLGAVVGAGVLYLIASGGPDYSIEAGLGQNGYGLPGSPGGYSLLACAVFEAIAAFLLVAVVLGVTQPGAMNAAAGLAIGLSYTLIHIVGLEVTGVSVNPARSLGPAVWVLGDALAQLWLFIAAPMLGAGLAACAFRVKLFTIDEA